MLRYFYFISVFSLLVFAGCRTTSNLNLNSRSISSAEVQKAVRSYHSEIHTMMCEGQISIETPDIAQSGSFILNLQKPDSILISIRGPFGIKVGSILITRTEFFFYNSLQNKLITGSSNADNLSRILHIRIGFDDLLNLFAGGTFFEEDLHSADENLVEDGQFVLVYSYHNSSRRYWIDPETLAIRKIQFIDQNGKPSLEQVFSDFEEADGVTIPHIIRITQPKARQKFALSYSDIRLNTDQLKFTLTIPQNAERIRW
jgi:outer membrane lipoprotein-sorting protein